MIPFIHIGPITLATFGLMVGVAMLVAYFIVAKDFARRGINAPADLLVAVPCIAGLIGAKLYHVFEDPRFLFAHPGELISQYGFAWFGGFLGGLAAFLWLAHHYRIPFLEIFDAVSPAAALGYGIGRIGCLLSGDGDYGIPTSLPWGMSFPNGTVPTTQRVHPTPIYELIAAIFIFWWLWKLGGRQARARLTAAELGHTKKGKPGVKNQQDRAELWAPQGNRMPNLRSKNMPDDGSDLEAQHSANKTPVAPPPIVSSRDRLGNTGTPRDLLSHLRLIPRGMVFAQYLILTGIARFLVEFIRINPRSFFGMTNAQTAALASIILGVVLAVYLPRSTPSGSYTVAK